MLLSFSLARPLVPVCIISLSIQTLRHVIHGPVDEMHRSRFFAFASCQYRRPPTPSSLTAIPYLCLISPFPNKDSCSPSQFSFARYPFRCTISGITVFSLFSSSLATFSYFLFIPFSSFRVEELSVAAFSLRRG